MFSKDSFIIVHNTLDPSKDSKLCIFGVYALFNFF